MPKSTPTLKVKANNFEFEFTREELAEADFQQKSSTEASLISNYRSVNIRLHSSDISGKNCIVELDGEKFDIEIKDELDLRLDQMGFNTVSTKHIKEIKAPMPGMVLEVSVTESQDVNEGDRLLILSAMKMENSIQIQASARIKKILVKAGQAVEKGQLLIELE